MMKKDEKNMKLNTPDILWKLDNLADTVCLDNDNVVRWCIDQNDHDNVPDRTARGILQKHGLKLSDLKTLDKDDFSIILFSGNSQNTQDILIYLSISKTKALIQSVVTIYL